jgi:hypothetical protein
LVNTGRWWPAVAGCFLKCCWECVGSGQFVEMLLRMCRIRYFEMLLRMCRIRPMCYPRLMEVCWNAVWSGRFEKLLRMCRIRPMCYPRLMVVSWVFFVMWGYYCPSWKCDTRHSPVCS